MKIYLLLPLLAVAACGPANRSLDTQKAPVISTSDAGFELRFSGDRLDPAQAKVFADYLAAIGASYGDRVLATPVTAGQRAEIDRVLNGFRLKLEDAAVGTAAPGVVGVTIRRMTATVPGCPDWSRKSNPEAAGGAMSNFGCGAISNLAAMLVDPSDLVEGKTYRGADGMTVVKGIKAYRESGAL